METMIMTTQNITSKNTALSQVASTFKAKRYAELFVNSVVLDYGCGKGLSRDYCLNTLGVRGWYGWDKYQEGFTDGEAVEKFIIDGLENKNTKHIITVNNVLNVLQNDTDIKGIFALCLGCVENIDCKVIFKIYEGDGTGIGKVTKKDCYQRNEKTENYEKMLNEFMRKTYITGMNVERHGQYIELYKITHE